jgi:hypothetical protein
VSGARDQRSTGNFEVKVDGKLVHSKTTKGEGTSTSL